MDYVTPKKIVSPYSGQWCTPKLKEVEYNDRIVVEAHWYCPASGKFVTRGIVREIPKNTEKQDSDKE